MPNGNFYGRTQRRQRFQHQFLAWKVATEGSNKGKGLQKFSKESKHEILSICHAKIGKTEAMKVIKFSGFALKSYSKVITLQLQGLSS
jgi:hypothetical protein